MVCFRLLIINSFLDVTLRCITTTKCNPKTRQFVSCQRNIQNLVENEIKKLQVATVYYNMGDLNMAKSLLKELEQSSFDKIKNDAKSLLREIDR